MFSYKEEILLYENGEAMEQTSCGHTIPGIVQGQDG